MMPKRTPIFNLFYLSHNPYGGWATYTTHLMKSFEAMGVRSNLFKIGNRTENKLRDFGYGVQYQNLCLEDALKVRGKSLITAAGGRYKDKTIAMLEGGAWIVKHDPGEDKYFKSPKERTIVIRRVNKRYGKFIQHPFVPSGFFLPEEKRGAATISRIDSDKRFELILKCNRLMKRKIAIHGFGHTSYARFYLKDKYPEWAKVISVGGASPTKFPKDSLYRGVEILLPKKFAVDLSVIKNDGGGSQYTFMEAWDAGCVQVVNSEWIIDGDEMVSGVNCVAVEDEHELKEVLTSNIPTDEIVRNGKTALKFHAPEVTVPRYLEVMYG